MRELYKSVDKVTYRANVTERNLHELGQCLGGISGDAIAHAHERIQRKLLKDKQLSKRIDWIYQAISQ